MKRRLMILLHWLRGRRNGVTLPELLSFLVRRTCVPRGRDFIDSTEERDGFRIVRIKGIERPLWLPVEFGERQLCQVVTEQSYEDDWHRYEHAGMVVRPDDIVVDAGAAEGLFALMVVDRCAKVYAVEPLPRFQEALLRTFDGVENFELLPVALSSEPGEAVLSVAGIHSTIGDHAEGAKVRVATLDELFADRPYTYLKADLEGFEQAMLAGATESIRRYRPRLALTTYHRADDAERIAALLMELVPEYRVELRGVEDLWGVPVMLHAWVPDASSAEA